jgi:Rrf2 family protein
MLSRKAKYGLQAVFLLAKDYGKGPVLISELAGRAAIPKKFLESILLELKKYGILDSKKGKGGGYLLGRPPNEITMGKIIRVLDGPLAPVSCVSQMAYRKCTECIDERTCGIRLVMKEVRDTIADVLDNTSLENVISRVKEIEDQIAG